MLSLGKQIRSHEAVDGKNPITAVTTMPAPHCSVVFGSADSVLRFIDPRKPGVQVVISLGKLILSRPTPYNTHQLSIITVFQNGGTFYTSPLYSFFNCLSDKSSRVPSMNFVWHTTM